VRDREKKRESNGGDAGSHEQAPIREGFRCLARDLAEIRIPGKRLVLEDRGLKAALHERAGRTVLCIEQELVGALLVNTPDSSVRERTPDSGLPRALSATAG
jgi:hypothetical protein